MLRLLGLLTLLAGLSGCTKVQQAERPPRTDPSAEVITGAVVKIADGDTLTVLDSTFTEHKIRLEGIDTPERRQAFGTRARMALGNKVFQRTVHVEWTERDRYGRILGQVFVGDRWINKEMVEDGWAWHYRQYYKDPEFAAAEQHARDNRRGLWADPSPVPPWEFRRNPDARGESSAGKSATRKSTDGEATRSKDTDRPANSDTVYVTRTGDKYHRASCAYLRKGRIAMPLSEAKKKYVPCSVCRPDK